MCDNKNIHIGEQVKYYRTLKNMSQESLALSAGINPAFVGHIERGIKSPTVNTLQKISNALEISLAELFTPPKQSNEVSQERSLDMERILFLLKDLSDEDLAAMTKIILNIVKIKKSE